jgi:hypothetical protein
MTLKRTLLHVAWCALVGTLAGCVGSNSSAGNSSDATTSATISPHKHLTSSTSPNSSSGSATSEPPSVGSTKPNASNTTLQGIYATSTVLFANNYGILPGNLATTNDIGFAKLHTAMITSPGTSWHVIFPPGTYTYTNNRWLWGIRNAIIDAYGATFQNISSDANYGNGIPLMVNDPFDDSGDVPWPHTTYVDGYLINTADAGASSVTTTTAANAENFTVGMPVLVYGYDQQGSGYPPNMRYFEYKTVLSANASTGVVTFTDQLQNFYDSRWWDTGNYAGTGEAYGAPRILSLARARYTQANLIWIMGATFLGNPLTSSSFEIQLPSNELILEDVSGVGFNIVLSNTVIVERGSFSGNQSTCDKLVNDMTVDDTLINPSPGYVSALTDCVGTNNLLIHGSKLYGSIADIAPRNLTLNDVDIVPSTSAYQGIFTASNNPLRSVSIGNTSIYNSGQSFGFTEVASPGNSLVVGSVSGTNIQMNFSQTVADQIDYGMTLTDTMSGNSGVVTGIYSDGGLLVITGTWAAPSAGDVFHYYDVINEHDRGGNVIVGTQVPFWRVPASLNAPPSP